MAIVRTKTGGEANLPEVKNELVIVPEDIFAVIDEHTPGLMVHLDGNDVIQIEADKKSPMTVKEVLAEIPQWDAREAFRRGVIAVLRDGKWYGVSDPFSPTRSSGMAPVDKTTGIPDVTTELKSNGELPKVPQVVSVQENVTPASVPPPVNVLPVMNPAGNSGTANPVQQPAPVQQSPFVTPGNGLVR